MSVATKVVFVIISRRSGPSCGARRRSVRCAVHSPVLLMLNTTFLMK